MMFQSVVKGRGFACDSCRDGVYELIRGAYMQHRGTGQTPTFRDAEHFKCYVRRMLRESPKELPIVPPHSFSCTGATCPCGGPDGGYA